MSDRKNLPAKALSQEVVVPTRQLGSLVARGLAAVHDIEKRSQSFVVADEAERQFRQGMYYMPGEHGRQADYEKARLHLTAAAELDHAEAQFELGMLFDPDIGHLRHENGHWVARSAHLGFGPAISVLFMDLDQPETEKEELFPKACEWYEPRAIAGDAERQFEYAEILLGRPFNSESIREGFRWLQSSAAQDYRPACRRIGHEYLHAPVTKHTTQKGIYWLSRAVDLGDDWVATELGELYLRGHLDRHAGTQGREPHVHVKPDRKLAVYWYERGIAMGSARSAYILGNYYLVGDLLAQDLRMAEKWILHSAQRGYSSAQSLLGTEYASGARLRQDANAAIHWLALAAQNSTSVGVKLAEVYLEGKIVPRNLDESLKWLTYAADGGFGNRAMKLVAAKCFDGRFNAAEESTAQTWLAQRATMAFELVADMEQPRADRNALHLAEIYELGLGIEQDREKAIYWYRRSGLPLAKIRLEELGIDGGKV